MALLNDERNSPEHAYVQDDQSQHREGFACDADAYVVFSEKGMASDCIHNGMNKKNETKQTRCRQTVLMPEVGEKKPLKSKNRSLKWDC